MSKLEEMRESAREHIVDIQCNAYNTEWLENNLNNIVTEVWNEAIKECEGYKKALEDINSVTPADAERWGYYETINKIVGRANEALLPRADITSDK